MKNTALALFAIALTSSIAHAENTSAPAPLQMAAAEGATGKTPADFASHKQTALDEAAKRIKEWQERETCIQAAMDEHALKACEPKRSSRHRKN